MNLLPGPISSLDILSQLADPVIAIDLEGRILFWNQGAARLYGWSENEALGQSAHELLDTRSREPIEPLVDLLLREGRWEGELTRHSRSGEPIDVLSRWSLIRDPNGSPVARVLIDTDLTETRLRFHELRIAEERAREAAAAAANRESLLGSLLDGISDCAYLKDTESRYIAVNAATAALFGKTQEEIVGHTDSDLFPPRQAREIMAQDRQVLVSGKPLTIEEEVPGRPGGRYFHTIKSICRDRAGQVIGLVGVARDMRERKHLESALQQRERELTEAHRIAGIGTWRWDRATDTVTWSDEIYRIYGMDRGVRPANFAEIRNNPDSPASHRRFVELFERAFLFGEPYAMGLEIERPDGGTRWIIARGEPDTWQDGQVTGLRGTVIDISEQKNAENELRIANERLQNVMDSITDGLAILDRDLYYTYFNKSGANALGLRPEDIVGKRLGDIFPQNRNNIVAERYRRALETGEPCHFEVQHGAPLSIWAEIHCYPSAAGLTVYYRDVSERKRTEAALLASESRFRQLFESDLMGICIPDRFGAFKEGNNELLRMTGYTREELEAGLVRWDTMTPPEYAALDAEHIAEAARRGACTPYEKEYIRKDGSRVPILCGYALLEGSRDEYIGFVLDISLQRAAEAELREREQRFRLLAESLPELVWITDPVGSLTYLNTRFLDYCGIPAEKMLGFDWSLILHPEEAGHVRQRWLHTVETGDPYLIELRLRAQDGAFRYFLARALPMRNEAGEILRWVGSCTDVHDQKLAEEALRKSEKLAATGRLAASIAHEINNPLSSVTNSLYLALQDPGLCDETRSFLQMADQELNRVTHITTQTQRFHRQSKAASLTDISDTMTSVLTLFGPRLMARNIQVHRELQPGANLLCLDDELRQVFANLVSNSLDASADGERLRVRVRRVSGGIRVTVADTGCGIPVQMRKRIFEPFFSTKDATGIGLGLWVSDGILRKHRARLSLRSSTAPGRHGTAISLFLPLDGVPPPPAV
jgi:PAS domain S-box-containing protein